MNVISERRMSIGLCDSPGAVPGLAGATSVWAASAIATISTRSAAQAQRLVTALDGRHWMVLLPSSHLLAPLARGSAVRRGVGTRLPDGPDRPCAPVPRECHRDARTTSPDRVRAGKSDRAGGSVGVHEARELLGCASERKR